MALFEEAAEESVQIEEVTGNIIHHIGLAHVVQCELSILRRDIYVLFML